MTKSSVDKSRSRYGDFVTLRFHKPTKTYHLTRNGEHLLAKFTELDENLAVHCWETFENLFEENERMKKELSLLAEFNQKPIL